MTTFDPISNLVPIAGKWDFSTPERPIYQAPQADWGRPFGICVSGVRFVEGEARVTVKIPNFKKDNDSSGRILIGYRALDADYLLVGFGGSKFAYTLYQFESGTGWQPIVLCGNADNIIPTKSYKISVHVQGQRLVFKESDITVFEHLLKSPIPVGQLGLFTWGPDQVEFTDFSVRQGRGSAFVIMGFAEPYLGLYNEVIKPVVESERFRLKALHAGETFGRVILQDILRGLEEARVVIAEITPANKTVFYELGYAHALKKDTILLVEKDNVCELPFDIKGYRCILYENTIVGKRRVQTELESHLESIIRPNLRS
jgi:hypothetical protein